MGDIRAHRAPRPRGRLVATATVIATLLGLFLCVGLPGGALYEYTNRLLFGGDPWARLPDDGAWPLALYLTLLWPVGVAPAYQLATRLHARLRARTSALRAALLAWAVGLVAVLAWGMYLAVCAYLGGWAWLLILGSTLAAIAISLWLGWWAARPERAALAHPVADFLLGPTAAALAGNLWRRWRAPRRPRSDPRDAPPK